MGEEVVWPNPKQPVEAKEMFYVFNLARFDPLWFSNNVLESVHDRHHVDNNYWSFAGHYIKTEEKSTPISDLSTFLANKRQQIPLLWNSRVEQIIMKKA